MSLYSAIIGSSSGGDIGAYAVGAFDNNPNYLALDGSVYSKSAYPDLDTSSMLTFGSNTATTRQTLGLGTTMRFEQGNGLVVAFPAASSTTTYYTSADDGVTFTSRTAPTTFSSVRAIAYANGLWFFLPTGSPSTIIYTSPDCITWTSRTVTNGYWGGGVGYVGGQYVIVSNYQGSAAGTVYGLRSTDAITWTQFSVTGVYYSSSGSYNFYPEYRSLTNHPSMGLVFSQYDNINGYTSIISTNDAVNFTSRLMYSRSGGDFVVNPNSLSVVADDCGALVGEGFSTGISFRGTASSVMHNTMGVAGINASYLQRGRKNIRKCSNAASSSTAISEDFGRTLKNVGIDLGSQIITANKLIGCSSSGVIKTVDIDTTKFCATVDTANYQDYSGKIYVKVL